MPVCSLEPVSYQIVGPCCTLNQILCFCSSDVGHQSSQLLTFEPTSQAAAGINGVIALRTAMRMIFKSKNITELIFLPYHRTSNFARHHHKD